MLAPEPVRPADDDPGRRRLPTEVPVFAIALIARMLPALAGAGFGGTYRYDPGVYYAAGSALGFGRLPYTDFVFQHPPVMVLVLSPFGWLGRVTSDHTGFVVASLAFMILGAVNAVLVVRIARRMKLGPRGAALGGGFYALWPGALGAEWELRLETLGNFCVLVGLLAWFTARESLSRRPLLLSGIALGAAVVVKVWFVVPLLVVLVATALRRSGRRTGIFAAGAGGAILVIAGPFFVLAPGAMWQMTVVQQLDRTRSTGQFTDRLGDLTGLHRLAPHLGTGASIPVYVLAAALFAVVLLLAWHIGTARALVVLTLLELIVLAAVPSWTDFYADLLAPSAALCVGAAAARAAAHAAWGRTAWAERLRRFGWLPGTLVAAASLVSLAFVPGHKTAPFPGGRLAAAVADRRCVQSDSPTALIELNALSRGLRDGCRNWIDVSGGFYGADDGADGAWRSHNQIWQRDLLDYFESGDAVILLRAESTGVSPATMRALRRPGVAARVDGFVVYRTASP